MAAGVPRRRNAEENIDIYAPLAAA